MVINFLEIVLEIILTPFSFGWMPSLKFNSGFKATSLSKKGINNSLNFDQEMSFEEFKIMLEKYDRVSGYPDIDN